MQTDKNILAEVFARYDRQQRFSIENAIYRHSDRDNPLTKLLLEAFDHIKDTRADR